MKEIKVKAKTENLDEVLDFVNEVLEEGECPMKLQVQIDIAVEEIFVNIAHYAYEPGEGDALICAEVTGDPKKFVIRFKDSGVPFDPLKKEDPDVSLPAEERQIGGLGIFMVKKSMDDVIYEYKDGTNNLTLEKLL